jgi:hypothetical protein
VETNTKSKIYVFAVAVIIAIAVIAMVITEKHNPAIIKTAPISQSK